MFWLCGGSLKVSCLDYRSEIIFELRADILMKLAGLREQKADWLWEDWQDTHNAAGPVMDGDWLQGMTRQTQELDFSGLVQRSYRVEYLIAEEDVDISIAGAVEKDSALALVDVLDEQALRTQALSVSHSENVSAWVKALPTAQTNVPQRLVAIQALLKMPLSELWLAALLGGFSLEQRGGFYETSEIWVSAAQESG
jgi:hypothetical protein